MCESCFIAVTSETFVRDEQVEEMAGRKVHKRVLEKNLSATNHICWNLNYKENMPL